MHRIRIKGTAKWPLHHDSPGKTNFVATSTPQELAISEGATRADCADFFLAARCFARILLPRVIRHISSEWRAPAFQAISFPSRLWSLAMANRPLAAPILPRHRCRISHGRVCAFHTELLSSGHSQAGNLGGAYRRL